MHVLLQWDNLAYVAVVSKALGHGVRRRKNIKRVKERKRKENFSSSPDPIFFFYFHMWVLHRLSRLAETGYGCDCYTG